MKIYILYFNSFFICILDIYQKTEIVKIRIV